MDSDLGEMFLKFPLDKDIQLSPGIDLTPYKEDLEVCHPELKGESNRLIVVWNMTWMGYIPSS